MEKAQLETAHDPNRLAKQERVAPSVFTPGTVVVYGMHGKCVIQAIENREIQGDPVPFYRLEIQKSALSRSIKREPSIWLPVSTSREQGLRHVMSREDAEAAMGVLASREYFFPVKETWGVVQPKLEACVRREGGSGLAKVMSYLHVLKRKHLVLSTEINRFHESVQKLLYRELSEALGLAPRTIEEQVAKALEKKLLPDT